MKKIIDGIELIDGEEYLSYKPNLFTVIQGFGEILGENKMNEYLYEYFGEDANFYPNYSDIGLGESKGWARPRE